MILAQTGIRDLSSGGIVNLIVENFPGTATPRAPP